MGYPKSFCFALCGVRSKKTLDSAAGGQTIAYYNIAGYHTSIGCQRPISFTQPFLNLTSFREPKDEGEREHSLKLRMEPGDF
jgi:hypothetical protein